jgi:hypothetical protein
LPFLRQALVANCGLWVVSTFGVFKIQDSKFNIQSFKNPVHPVG